MTTNLLLHFFSLSIFCVSFFFSKIITNFQSFFSLSKYVDSSITPKDRQQCSLCVNHYYSFENLACQRRVSALRNAISLWLDLISIFFYFDFGRLLQIGKGALFTTQFVDVLYHEQKIVTHVFCYFCWMFQNTGPVRIRGTRSLGVLFLSLERRGVWESERVSLSYRDLREQKNTTKSVAQSFLQLKCPGAWRHWTL